MKGYIGNILQEIDIEIDEIDLYGYDIIETSLSMVHRLQAVLNDLRTKIQTYIFPTKEDEILFFKTQKPEILGRLLFFYKIYKIETQCPNGSDEVIRNYINRELDNLTYFFNRNLDFYQYYRSHSTVYDEYYFVRGRNELQEFAFAVRHQNGGQGKRSPAAHRHIGFAHEERYHHQPQQVYTWAEW